jgi:hypothetical protein
MIKESNLRFQLCTQFQIEILKFTFLQILTFWKIRDVRSMANLDSRSVEQKALLSVCTCLVVLISREDPSLRASRWYSPLPLQLHVGATVPPRVP